MKLLDAKTRKALPPMNSTEETPVDQKTIVAKFFGPGRWTWYAAEFDGEDTFFGFVKSGLGEDCDEWGYFSLSEFEVNGIERDLHFRPAPFVEAVLR